MSDPIEIEGATGPHFSSAELGCHGTTCNIADRTRGCGQNRATSLLVDALERFRVAIGGKPTIVHDAYRCAIHNGQVSGSATDSQHVLGNAADVSVVGMTAAQMEAMARSLPQIRGIGRNDKAGWIHIDVRPSVVLAMWCYNDKGWCSYFPPPSQEINA